MDGSKLHIPIINNAAITTNFSFILVFCMLVRSQVKKNDRANSREAAEELQWWSVPGVAVVECVPGLAVVECAAVLC